MLELLPGLALRTSTCSFLTLLHEVGNLSVSQLREPLRPSYCTRAGGCGKPRVAAHWSEAQGHGWQPGLETGIGSGLGTALWD